MNWQTSSGAHASLAIDGTHVRNFGPCINAPSGLGRKANLRPEGSWYKVPRDRDGGLALYPQLQFVASRDIGEGEELLWSYGWKAAAAGTQSTMPRAKRRRQEGDGEGDGDGEAL